jgi:parvulin-like peptidyl-prolyl isomerase
MTAKNQISDPIETATGTYIFKLVDSSPLRFVPDSQLNQVRQTGFDLWLTDIRNGARTWVDPQYQAASTTA